MRDGVLESAFSSDPLAEAIGGLGIRSWVPGPFQCSSPWTLQVRGELGWCYLLQSGECRVEIEGDETVMDFVPGDLVIVPQGRAHRLVGPESGRPVVLEDVLGRPHFENRDPLTCGGGGVRTSLAGVCFVLEKQSSGQLLASLPSLLKLGGVRGHAAAFVDQIFRLIQQETTSNQPCAQTVINCLVRILLIKAIREYVWEMPAHHTNWLRALVDADIGRALGLMHAQPAVAWTVASLAAQVAMSRTTFSTRFTDFVGKPPLEYLTDWRMQQACVLLTSTDSGLKEIASQVGYDSAAAFSKAFSRWSGAAPTAYRDGRRTASQFNRVPPMVR